MKIGRKLLAVALVAAMLLGLGAAAALAGGEIELHVVDWNEQQIAIWNQVIDQFKAIHPEVKVVYDIVPFAQYWTKLEAAAATGDSADILCMNPLNIERFVLNGALLPLTAYIARDSYDMSVFDQTYRANWEIGGETYALPKDVDGFGVFYNKQIFDDAGVPYPSDDWTWEDFKATVCKLANPEKNVYGLSYGYTDLKACVYPVIFSYGGYILSEDKATCGYGDPKTQEAIQYIYDLVNACDYAAPTLQQTLETNVNEYFLSGHAAMQLQGSWMLNTYLANENVSKVMDIAPMPVGATNAKTANGVSWAISSGSKNPELAWELLKMICGEPGAIAQGTNGGVIPANKNQQHLYTQGKEKHVQAFLQHLDESIFQPVTLNMSDWRAVETNYYEMIFTGEMPVKEACDSLAAEMNAILAEK